MKWKILGSFLALYFLGYGFARKNLFIVHSVVRDHTHHYLEHSVVAGDGKLFGGYINELYFYFYTPLRYIECRYWYIRHPIGTPLSKAHRDNLTR